MEIVGRSPVWAPLLVTGKAALALSWLFPVLPPLLSGPFLFDSAPVRTAGIVIYLAGASVAGIALLNLGRSTVVGLPDRETRLKTEGMYRFSRNPVYLGALVMCLGSCLVSPFVLNVLSFAAAALIHDRIIRSEERFLRARFGMEWMHYSGRVRRWVGRTDAPLD
jgi:protein-S-isoprenylcysteine O-methyltransferase Ste14